MNPTSFSELLTDISDEYIVSAANPRSNPIRWYHVSSAAAVIVLLISAAVYPMLRTRKPDITEPPAYVDDTTDTTFITETTAPVSTNSSAGQTHTTAASGAETTQTVTAESSAEITTQTTIKPGTETAAIFTNSSITTILNSDQTSAVSVIVTITTQTNSTETENVTFGQTTMGPENLTTAAVSGIFTDSSVSSGQMTASPFDTTTTPSSDVISEVHAGKCWQEVYDAFAAGAQTVDVNILFWARPEQEIRAWAASQADEYVLPLLDDPAYSDEEISRIREAYYTRIYEKAYNSRSTDRANEILALAGICAEDAVCDHEAHWISCSVTQEQIKAIENLDYLRRIMLKSTWERLQRIVKEE